MKSPKKILIFRLSSIGDIILTTALVRCVKIKFPEAEISFVIKKEFSDLIKHNPNITNVITFDKSKGFKGLFKLRKEIKSSGFDVFIDIHNNIRSNIIKFRSGISTVTKYSKRILHRTVLIKLRKNLYENNELVLLRYFEAVKKLNVYYDNNGTDVFFSEKEEAFVADLLNKQNIKAEKMAVICPGASYLNKQWKLEGFAAVANFLREELNMDVVLLGGKNDIESCEKISELAGFNYLNIAGEFNLLDSAALLKKSVVTITNDSGMMHLAQAQKSAVVAIFGPTTKELGYFPIPIKSMVVEKELNCRPCTHKGLNYCPKKHFNCMRQIEADEVISGIKNVLNV